MNIRTKLLAAGGLALLLSGCSRASHPPAFDLHYDRLSGPLDALSPAERDAVGDTIALIRKGEHALALARLSSLNEAHPQNSSLRILTSYALLQTGNLVGAFEEAERAHEAPDRMTYKCWFLGKVALLTGHQQVCERELHHLERAGDMLAETNQLRQESGRN